MATSTTGYPGKKSGVGGIGVGTAEQIAQDKADAALDDHEIDTDPHPQYATDDELDDAISAHVALADPHSQYATDADLAAQVIADHADVVISVPTDGQLFTFRGADSKWTAQDAPETGTDVRYVNMVKAMID